MAGLDVSQFTPVRLEHRQRLQPFLEIQQPILSHYNIAVLYCWANIFQTEWLIWQERLFIYHRSIDWMLMPLGEYFSSAEMVQFSTAWQAAGKSGRIGIVDPDYVKAQPQIADYFDLSLDEDNADYVYLTKKLAELKGNKLSRKRNLIAQFKTQFPEYERYVCLNLEQTNMERCWELAQKWSRHKGRLESGSQDELQALRLALLQFSELALSGLGISVGDDLLAFAIFSRQNSNTATVHFEKFHPGVKGAAQVINWELAKLLEKNFKYLNREQDLGIEGLRRAKRSYYPEYIVKSYSLIPKTGRRPGRNDEQRDPQKHQSEEKEGTLPADS